MTEVFVIRNQLGHYWGKSKTWVNGSDPRTVLRVKHQDEGVNSLVELSAKDVELRGEVLAAELNERGEPLLTVSDIPLPEMVEAETPAPTPETGTEAQTAGAAEPDDPESTEAEAKSANGA